MGRIKFYFKNKSLADVILNQLFYFIFVVVYLISYSDFDFQNGHLIWSVRWIKYISNNVDVVQIITIIACVSPFLTLWKKTRRFGQLSTFICIFLLVSISYSYGKVQYRGSSWLMFFPVLFISQYFTSVPQAAHFAFFCFSTSYLNSAIWKLRSFAGHIVDTMDFSVILHTLQEHIADVSIESMKSPTVLGSLILENDFLSGAFWILGIGVQILPLFILFLKGRAYLFSMAFLIFHISAFFILGINFLPAMALNFILTIYFWVVRDELIKNIDFSKKGAFKNLS